MWKRFSTCLRRHRRKLFIAGGVIGGFVLLNNYLRKKFIEWEAKRTLEYFEAIKRQNHFERSIQTCDTALLSFVPKISEIVSTTLDVNPVVEALKTKPPNKIELWEELKVLVFTQAVGEMYAQSLFVVLLRVQISILGGYMYTDFHKSKSFCGEVPVDLGTTDNHQKYLSKLTSFFVSGIKELLKPIENSVRAVMQDVKLKELLMLKDITELLNKIRFHISEGKAEAIPSVSRYVMLTDCKDQNQNENAAYDSFLLKITDETKDVLECEDFNKVLQRCIDLGFAIMMDRFSECFVHINNNDTKFVNPNNLAVPLAKVIPRMHTIISQHKPNEQGSLMHILLQEDTLKAFAANIYESFSQYLAEV